MNVEERTKPQMSANMLASYIQTSNPLEEDRILQNAKYPKSWLASYYNLARTTVMQYILSQPFDHQILEQGIRRLQGLRIENDHQKHRQQANIEAIEGCAALVDDLEELQGRYAISEFGSNVPRLLVHDVQVSAGPELRLDRHFRNTDYIGAIKFYFRSQALGKVGAGYVGTCLHQVLDQMDFGGAKLNPRNVLIIDFRAREMWEAPHGQKNRMKRIKSTCRKVNDLWDNIDAPD